MVEDLIQLSNHDESGFYLHNHDELIKINRIRPVRSKCNSDRGHFCFIGPHRKHQFQLQNTIIMETGGMKGRRKEMIRDELHQQLCKALAYQPYILNTE
jgi:hypothetical protein